MIVIIIIFKFSMSNFYAQILNLKLALIEHSLLTPFPSEKSSKKSSPVERNTPIVVPSKRNEIKNFNVFFHPHWIIRPKNNKIQNPSPKHLVLQFFFFNTHWLEKFCRVCKEGGVRVFCCSFYRYTNMITVWINDHIRWKSTENQWEKQTFGKH